MIVEFEKGICPEEALLSVSKYGVVNHTLVMREKSDGEPHTKRKKTANTWDKG